MNSKITVSLAGLALLAALAGCNKTGSASAAQASQRAHALATSSQAQEAQAEGQALAGTCLPAKDLNRAYFVQLALNLKTAEALAAKCEVPKEKIPAFAKDVISSASTAYLSGKFSTSAQRQQWAQKELPLIVKKHQGKS